MDKKSQISGRRRYSIRLAKVAAGSALTAASVVSLSGFTIPPQAEPAPTFQPEPKSSAVHGSAAAGTAQVSVATQASAVTQASAATQADVAIEANSATNTAAPTANSASTRLAGVSAELAHAVVLGLVTQDQAQGFLAQLEARISRGL